MHLQVLVLHFKRFLFGHAEKLDWHITHDGCTLDLLGVTYDLVGVLNHIGKNITSGHYNFDAVCPTTRRAWRCSDANDPWLLSREQLRHDFETAYIHVWQRRPLPEEQANVEEQGLRATSDEQQRREGLQANNDNGNGTPIGNGTGSISTSQEQQVMGGLPASEAERNGKLIGNCRGPISTTLDEKDCLVEDEERKRTMALVEEREAIWNVSSNQRSDEQKKRLRQVCYQIKKTEEKYPEITAKRPAKSQAERKDAERQRQSEEKKEQEKAKDKTRKAEERQSQSEEKKEQEKAKNKTKARQRMAAKRANIAVKPKDGLNAQLTLSGSFRVDTNHLGAMDEVRALP